MKHLNTLLLSLTLLLSSLAQGQLLRDHEVNESTIKPWVANDLKEYAGRYIFQPNDGNYLIVIIDDTNLVAQIQFPGHWTEGGNGLELGLADSSEYKIHSEYVNLSSVKISDGKFYSDEYKGEFISFDADKTYKGVKIYDSWSIWPGYTYEIGVKRKEKLEEFMFGDYKEASISVLDSSEVSMLTKEEMQIMRNEIFARYHYKFKEGGKMALYFSQKEWFTNSPARYKSVRHMLTWIELQNIELIKYYEEKK